MARFRKTWKRPFRPSTRKLARKRTTWALGFNSACEAALLCPAPCGPNGPVARIELLSQPDLQSLYSDRASVVRILGDLHFAWQLDLEGDCDELLDFLGSAAPIMRMGLVRQRVTTLPGNVPQTLRPLTNDFDYTEAGWLKMWEHGAWPRSRLTQSATTGSGTVTPAHTITGTIETCCGVVAGESPGIIATLCEPCVGPVTLNVPAVNSTSGGVELCTREIDFPNPWSWHIDHKRTIPMRESETLNLWIEVGFATMDDPVCGLIGGPNVGLSISGGLRLLIQMG